MDYATLETVNTQVGGMFLSGPLLVGGAFCGPLLIGGISTSQGRELWKRLLRSLQQTTARFLVARKQRVAREPPG